MTRYFEDLELGEVAETGEYTVTRAEIVEFAEQFDPRPFHLDEEAARESIFGGIVASGIHTLALSMRISVDGYSGEIANMGGIGLDDVRFHHPVYPGDTLSVRLEIVGKEPSERRPERGYVDVDRRVRNDDGQEVLSYVTHGIVRRREPGAGGSREE